MSNGESFNPWGLAVAIVLAGAVMAGVFWTSRPVLPVADVQMMQPSVEVAGVVRQAEEAAIADSGMILGIDSAPVAVQLFTDWRCDACRQFFEEVLPELENEYIDAGQVRVAVESFPVGLERPDAQLAAEAVECAASAGSWRDFAGRVMAQDEELTEQLVEQMAEEAGLDRKALSDCLLQRAKAGDVTAGAQAAVRAGVTAVPALLVGDKMFEGLVPYATLKEELILQLSTP